MMITADQLRQEIANLEQQMIQYANLYQQATGAIALARAMLQQLEPGNGLTVNQFAEAIGGKGSTAEIVPLEGVA